ncbi:hypothetical protein JRO89_XS03G0003200 [Xanthoceras sorbifolium]|uniref:Expansin-like EG45 domain-containing protein n=1 Tax=Xanthoceras sorbifolium TaxID=99658 RepID=A0ABQ8I8C6_9ROSI|nr:hypothetical protein JRO89_XS03G0003200 [Xanthoceras sorbifolium]
MAFQLKNNSSIALLVLLIISLYSSLASAQYSGTATFTEPPYTPSACYHNEDHGVLVAAANTELYLRGVKCGEYYQIRCISIPGNDPCLGGTTTVMITDHCDDPKCPALVLSKDAFAAIADLDAGVINMDMTL